MNSHVHNAPVRALQAPTSRRQFLKSFAAGAGVLAIGGVAVTSGSRDAAAAAEAKWLEFAEVFDRLDPIQQALLLALMDGLAARKKARTPAEHSKAEEQVDPPPLKWSALKYGFGA